MAEWDRPAKRPAGNRRERPLPEPARETDPLPEMHPEQHWAPWETPSHNPGRVAARQVPVSGGRPAATGEAERRPASPRQGEQRPKRGRGDDTGGKLPGGAE